MSIYKNNSFFTRLHVWLRFKTCPFLELERYVPKEGIIIDYGCGHGLFSHILSIRSPLRKIFGVDISRTKIKEAKKATHNNINFLNISDIDEFIKQADCIIFVDVLCYLSNQKRQELLFNLFNNLKKGALVIIKDMSKSFSLKYLWLFLQELIVIKILGITEAASLNFCSIRYCSRILKNIGFDLHVVNLSSHYLYPHVVYICKKI